MCWYSARSLHVSPGLPRETTLLLPLPAPAVPVCPEPVGPTARLAARGGPRLVRQTTLVGGQQLRPNNAINQLEMGRADTCDPVAILADSAKCPLRCWSRT